MLRLFVLVLLLPTAAAQPGEHLGPFLDAGVAVGGTGALGPGMALTGGWAFGRVALTLGATGAFVANDRALWAALPAGDAARADAEAATRATAATFDLGAEWRLRRGPAGPFVGLAFASPVVATEGADDRRVFAGGRGVSVRAGIRHRVAPGVALVADVRGLGGSLTRGFVGRDRTGRALAFERTSVRGGFVSAGVTVTPFGLR